MAAWNTSPRASASVVAGLHGRVGQHHERVSGATHAGCEVVEAEQGLEAVRVLLVLLQPLDQAELLVDERGVAPGQRREHLADLGAQLGLTGRQGARPAGAGRPRASQLAHLLVRGDGIVVISPGSSPARILATISGSCSFATSRAPSRTRRIGFSSMRETRSASKNAASSNATVTTAFAMARPWRVLAALVRLLVDVVEQLALRSSYGANASASPRSEPPLRISPKCLAFCRLSATHRACRVPR
jgi:hypothetical protein